MPLPQCAGRIHPASAGPECGPFLGHREQIGGQTRTPQNLIMGGTVEGKGDRWGGCGRGGKKLMPSTPLPGQRGSPWGSSLPSCIAFVLNTRTQWLSPINKALQNKYYSSEFITNPVASFG